MTAQRTIGRSDMPDPEALIDYGNGVVGAAMFHYATEEADAQEIARYHGFEIQFLHLEDDPGAEDLADYEDCAICAKWLPLPPEGWMLASKHDTDNGPIALFIRRLPQEGLAP